MGNILVVQALYVQIRIFWKFYCKFLVSLCCHSALSGFDGIYA